MPSWLTHRFLLVLWSSWPFGQPSALRCVPNDRPADSNRLPWVCLWFHHLGCSQYHQRWEAPLIICDPPTIHHHIGAHHARQLHSAVVLHHSLRRHHRATDSIKTAGLHCWAINGDAITLTSLIINTTEGGGATSVPVTAIEANPQASYEDAPADNTPLVGAFIEPDNDVIFLLCRKKSDKRCMASTNPITVTAVPETSTWFLMGLGVFGVGLILRRRNHVII